MKIYKDVKKHKPKIIDSINKFGFLPEHNYYHCLYKQTPSKRCIFFDFGCGRGIIALFNKKNKVWYVTNGILAPKAEMPGIFLEFVDYVLHKKNVKKISVETGEDFKSEIFRKLKNSKYKTSMNYTLNWPVINLYKWDEKLSGKEWKKFRNIRNRFHNNLQIKVKDAKKIGNGTLRSLLFSWLKRRHPRDRVDYSYYLNIINSKFMGFAVTRALLINNELCSVSAGWKIPNSDVFYSGIGIFNYKHKDMGDFANLDDLMHLKKIGYRHVDLGGSDKAILYFKKKFKPEKIYKTCIFSISRKK